MGIGRRRYYHGISSWDSGIGIRSTRNMCYLRLMRLVKLLFKLRGIFVATQKINERQKYKQCTNAYGNNSGYDNLKTDASFEGKKTWRKTMRTWWKT